MQFKCSYCQEKFESEEPLGVCTCGRPLLVELPSATPAFTLQSLKNRPKTIWRYQEVLPDCVPVSLGEGGTPLVDACALGRAWKIKDESLNPTGSFKARGMSVAVSMAKKFGLRNLAVPSAGNAAGALAAYCAAAGLHAHVAMPSDTPKAFIQECEFYGAHVKLIDGLIDACGKWIRGQIAQQREELSVTQGETHPDVWFDMSTLREPYRLEGKKTLGYELFEDLGGSLPDAIVYPAGGGTGLIGIGKAIDEMEAMGWIGPERPKMILVQAAGCDPIVRAIENSANTEEKVHANPLPGAFTVASGLRVPSAIGDFLMVDLVRKSGGCGVRITDEEMLRAAKGASQKTGVMFCPEGGACVAAAQKLAAEQFLHADEKVILFNTASGLKYLDVF